MDDSKSELNQFQLRNIDLLTKLFACDAINDEIVEILRKSELDYFSLLNKYNLLEHKINIDEKTNLLKYKPDYLTKIIKTASRIYFGSFHDTYPISFVRFDIDDFSLFNNKYGHDCGDQVLIMFADLIRENSRPTDYVIRFGGKEFDVILPSTGKEGARVYLNKIYNKIHETSINHNDCSLKITASAGISYLIYSFSEKFISNEDINSKFSNLQQEADNALYEAKFLGKDQYAFYDINKKNEYAKIRKSYIK